MPKNVALAEVYAIMLINTPLYNPLTPSIFSIEFTAVYRFL